MITAPFNFVPLNENVFFPNWAKNVSHDIPFEDGESGEIEIILTAKSPMFIRHHSKKEEFCHYPNGGEKNYYVPGSSLKGLSRNILEIMSFSKLSMFNDDTYAVRDMSSSKNFYMTKMKPKNTFCGWLKKVNNAYVIEDCGLPGRIRLDKIDKNFASHFSKDNFDEKKDDNKTAKYKYYLLKEKEIKLPQTFSHVKNDNGRDIYIFGDEKKGTVVFTGQSSGRVEGVEPEGKIYEFIFFKSKKEHELEKKDGTYPLLENFKFAYFDGRKTQPKESTDWKYWKEKLNKGEKIPVFFQKDTKDNIEHFGLSYLYKLPYKYSIKNAIESVSKDHFDSRADLAQTIFGYIDEDEKKALKGRVQFSHLKSVGNPKVFNKTVTTVLGTPRASYYPIYMKNKCQEIGMVEDGDYKTLMNKTTMINGRKRYPLHAGNPNPSKHSADEDSSVSFRPLGTYNEENGEFNEFIFKGKVRYHNLKRVELGALISALTFHGQNDTYYHNIGMGKPYGFGKISIDIDMNVEKQIELLQNYEELMVENIGKEWLESEELKELFSMAHNKTNLDHKLKYLVLDPKNGIDEFREKKTDRECFPYFSTFTKLAAKTPSSSFDTQMIASLSAGHAKKIECIKEQASLFEKEQKLLENVPDAFSKEFKESIKTYVMKTTTSLPYYDHGDLKKVLEHKEDDIAADDVYDAYMDLIDSASFQELEKLLIKREKNQASDLELAELYDKLIDFSK